MAQSINIKIAGRPYSLTAISPEHEEVIRKAAEELNSKIAEYQERFPDKGLAEILSFMSLNMCMSNIVFQRQLKAMNDAEERLAVELGRYLDTIDKSSR